MISYSTRRRRAFASSVSDAAKSPAFSLIEVTLAIGIAVFVLVALTGLMAVGLNAGRNAREDTTIATITRGLFSNLGTRGYAQITNADLYFTSDGIETNAAAAFYLCKIKAETNSIAFKPGLNRSQKISIQYLWPYDPAAPSKTDYPNEEVFLTTFAEY